MRSTVIPAQVTTVEDTIAGNLTLTQIILLIMPVLLSTAVYAVLPERLALTTYKIPLIIFLFVVFVVLALRIKGRIVLSWLSVMAIYYFRPHIFVFNKNTVYTRDLVLPPTRKPATAKAKVAIKVQDEDRNDSFDYESLLRNPSINIRFTRKGLLVVKNYD